VAAQLVASRAVLSSTELVRTLKLCTIATNAQIRSNAQKNCIRLKSRSKGKKKEERNGGIPVTGRKGPQGCEILRIPHCLDIRLTDDREAASLMRRLLSILQEHFYFCL
jgi:hypothetical protein